jgi:hypothetical protein
MFLKRWTPSRSWSQYQQVKTLRRLNNCNNNNDHAEEEEDNEDEEEGNNAEGEDDEDYTPFGDAEKEEMYHNADEIKTFGDEAPIPTSRLRNLLNRINITTPPEFRINRVLCPG